MVLTRNHGERIIIGDDVVITILGFAHDSVRLGIAAPDDVLVDREEIRAKRNHDREQGRFT